MQVRIITYILCLESFVRLYRGIGTILAGVMALAFATTATLAQDAAKIDAMLQERAIGSVADLSAVAPNVNLDAGTPFSGSTAVLVVLALWVLALLMHPLDRFDSLVLVAMIGLTAVAALTPMGQRFYELHWPDVTVLGILGVYTVGVIVVLTLLVNTVMRRFSPAAVRWRR